MIGPALVLLDGRFTVIGAPGAAGTGRRTVTGMVVAVLKRADDAWEIVAWRERDGRTFTSFPIGHRG